MKISKAIVTKVTESGKSIYVGAKTSKYVSGYTFGWCANPDNNKKDDELDTKEFCPVGRVPMYKEDGAVLHEDGSPVMQWIFA